MASLQDCMIATGEGSLPEATVKHSMPTHQRTLSWLFGRHAVWKRFRKAITMLASWEQCNCPASNLQLNSMMAMCAVRPAREAALTRSLSAHLVRQEMALRD